MGAIVGLFEETFRDYVTEGVRSSGVHKVEKSDARSLGVLIEGAIGTAGLGALVGVVKDTKANLDADLAHPSNTVALVYADATDANNDIYIKVGGSGSGSWTLTSAFHDIIGGLAQPYVDAAEAAASAASAVGLFPDAFFAASAAIGAALIVNGRDYLSAAQENKSWSPFYRHAFGQGAYRVLGNDAIAGWRVWFDNPQSVGLTTGDTITPIYLFVGTAGETVEVAARFIDNAGDYVGGQVGTSSAIASGDVQELAAAPVTIPVGAAGLEIWLWCDGGDVYVLDVDVARGSEPLPLRRIKWQQVPMSLNAARSAGVKAQADWAFLTTDMVDNDGRLDGIDVDIVSANPRTEGEGFTGFGQSYTTPGSFNANAFYAPLIPRGATTKKWARIDFTLRTHATDPANSSATLVAVGSVRVDPENGSLSDVYALMRDPITNEQIAITQANLAARYAVIWQAFTAGGERATSGETIATISGASKLTSYYVTSQNAQSATWTPYFTNPTLGVIAVQLDNPAQVTRTEFSPAARSSISESVGGTLPYTGTGLIRRVRAKLDSAKLSTPITSRINIGLFGDSYTANSAYYPARFADAMRQEAGDGGVGFFGVGWYDAGGGVKNYTGDARGLYYAAYTGTWTNNYHAGSTSPNTTDSRSSSAGAKITVASVAGATHPGLSAVKLHFTGTADGVVRYRWNGEAWTNLNVQGGVGFQQVADLLGFPTGALNAAALDAIMLEIEMVSGAAILSGVDFQSAANGVTIHKLGASGAKASDWRSSIGAQWEAGIAALNLDLVIFMTGPNDQAASASPAAVAADVSAFLASATAAIPSVDLMVMAPPENPTGYPTAMPLFAEALALAAASNRACFLNLQEAFGSASDPGEYADGSALELFLPDNIHPTYAGAVCGAARISGELFRTLVSR